MDPGDFWTGFRISDSGAALVGLLPKEYFLPMAGCGSAIFGTSFTGADIESGF